MSRGELQHGLPQPIQGRGANRLALVPWTRHGRRHWPPWDRRGRAVIDADREAR